MPPSQSGGYDPWLVTERIWGLDSNPGEGMDVYKCIVPLRQGITLKSRQAASPHMWLVEGEEKWDAPDQLQDVLPPNWEKTEPKRYCYLYGAQN
ncbi:hypothetical protein TNCV_99041 [Trichonephila clavipes]|nr:hypothetical protein TNCV_99041 [Trichonephila clavipes]